ncbi:hypothetical protein L0668_15365 [Paraglaciecola aquimarina]|uniref:Peptidase M48 domain-containing protein n=1 Tax=Paraglaciecola algarum TaxID=3050085 RepID=A0ABS9D989_9ALTE|nr:hypothetical protein [Paraglaciecola sp. G1-23]MCF2949498.1 hypothetical protein [Paraglaciecola sp. G1-23]
MKIIRLASFLVALLTCWSLTAGEVKRGEGISQKLFEKIVKNNPAKYPKLWQTIELVTQKNVDVYIEATKGSLGRAIGKKAIYLAPKMFLRAMDTHPEDRLVVVVLHEFGHVLFNRQPGVRSSSTADREYAAFKYSVKHALVMAELGDTGPIKQLIKYLPMRVKKGKKSAPHTQALKKLTKEKFWKQAVKTYE